MIVESAAVVPHGSRDKTRSLLLNETIASRTFRHLPGNLRKWFCPSPGQPSKTRGSRAAASPSEWRSSCPEDCRASGVSSSPLFESADVGSWAGSQPAVRRKTLIGKGIHDEDRTPCSHRPLAGRSSGGLRRFCGPISRLQTDRTRFRWIILGHQRLRAGRRRFAPVTRRT